MFIFVRNKNDNVSITLNYHFMYHLITKKVAALVVATMMVCTCNSNLDPDIEPEPDPEPEPVEVTISPLSHEFTAVTALTAYSTVTFGRSTLFTASSSQEWCAAVVNSGDTKNLRITVTVNESLEERTAVVTIFVNDIACPEVITVTQTAGKDNGVALSNPLMGWQYYGTQQEIIQSGIPDEFDIGVISCSWDILEPTKDGYDFELLDKAVNRLKQDGKTVYFRLYLMPDNVWGIEGYPAWIKQEVGIGTFKPVHFDNINGNGTYDFEHPDYSNAVWQGLVSKFLKYVASHYPDGAVDVIDARAYGLYGEWDSNWGNYWDESAPEYPAQKTAVLRQIVDIYKDAFKDHKLTKIAFNVSSEEFATVAEARAYLQEAALDKAFEAGFAVRFDGVGTNFNSSRHVMQTVLNDYFPTSPVFAETWYGWGDPTYLSQEYNSFIQVRSNGVSCGDYRKALAYNPDFFANGLKPNASGVQIGYRILPVNIKYSKEAVADGEILFSSKWKNTGTGVLYRHYPLKLSLIAASGQEVYTAVCDDFDITRLVRGETYEYNTSFRLPSGANKLAPGTYKVWIALADKNNNNKSAIKMPIGSITNITADYVIGEILII
jgi:hypothetical protein